LDETVEEPMTARPGMRIGVTAAGTEKRWPARLGAAIRQTAARVFYIRGKTDKPFDDRPDTVIPLNATQKNAPFTLLRDTPVVCDWNSDGIDELLVVGRGRSQEVLILHGGRGGLDRSHEMHDGSG
jgi:hypothetical protein